MPKNADSSKGITEATASHTPFTDKESLLTSRIVADAQMENLL
jgi:hypothetical protein